MLPARATLKLVPASTAPDARPELTTLFTMYHGWVAGVAARLCGRSAEVEDIVQDVFVLCARKIDTIPTVADAKPWLRTVAVRVVRRRLRREKWMAWFRSSDDGLMDLPYRGLAPDERAMLHALYATLASVPVDDRLAWSLRHLDGATLEEVARGCDCSLATAKRRIARAAQRLKEEGHASTED